MNTNDSQGNNNSSGSGGGGGNNNFRKNKRITANNSSNPKTKKQLENELNRQRSFFVNCGSQNPSATRHNNTHEVPEVLIIYLILYSERTILKTFDKTVLNLRR